MPNTPIFDIKNYIIDEYSFDRLIYLENCDIFLRNMDYEQFIRWNERCFNELSNNEKTFIKDLCDHIQLEKIQIMDEENCVSFTSEKIFFDENKKVVITCPR